MKILTVLPVSRIEYLDTVLKSLVEQSYEEQPALLVVVDGTDELFIKVHNKLASVPINDVLCIKSTNVGETASTIPERRQRISNIHNQIREYVRSDIDWVFSIEDDGILPTNALSWLVNAARMYPNVGLVTGVELGRWGITYVGAWKADDVFNPQRLTSLQSKVNSGNVEEIDACGLYCALIRADLYKQHYFTCSNGLGPDINMSIEIRQCGYQNYIDWFVPVTHITERNGETVKVEATDEARVVSLTNLGDNRPWPASM